MAAPNHTFRKLKALQTILLRLSDVDGFDINYVTSIIRWFEDDAETSLNMYGVDKLNDICRKYRINTLE